MDIGFHDRLLVQVDDFDHRPQGPGLLPDVPPIVSRHQGDKHGQNIAAASEIPLRRQANPLMRHADLQPLLKVFLSVFTLEQLDQISLLGALQPFEQGFIIE